MSATQKGIPVPIPDPDDAPGDHLVRMVILGVAALLFIVVAVTVFMLLRNRKRVS